MFFDNLQASVSDVVHFNPAPDSAGVSLIAFFLRGLQNML